MEVVVVLGGEGEVPDAINVNLLVPEMIVNPAFADALDPSLVIRRSAHDTGLDDDSVDIVIANHFPIVSNELISAPDGSRVRIDLLAAEVFRILKPGGRLRFSCSSCDREALLGAFEAAGLRDLVLTPSGYIEGAKP